MNPIQHIRRMAIVLAGLAAALTALGATPAFAMVVRPDPNGPEVGSVPSGPAPIQVHTIIAGGMPGWQITSIALGAALLAATVTVVLYRTLAARRAAAVTA